MKAKTVTIKIKHGDFSQLTRSVTLSMATCASDAIHKAASKLLHAYQPRDEVRLIGVGVSNLVASGTPAQMDLFSEEPRERGWEQVESAVDRIQKRFGKEAVQRASLKRTGGSKERPE